MYSTESVENESDRDQVNIWRVVRWLVTAAAAVVLVTLFLTQTSSTEAAAPVPSDDAVYQVMAACQPGNVSCIVAACQNGNYNYCGYNLGGFGNWYGVNWVWGNGPNWVYPRYIAPAYLAPNYFGYWNGFYGWPNYIAANNSCPSGNFSACFANNPWWWWGYPWTGTGVFSGNVTVVAPGGNPIQVGPPFRPKEVEQPATLTQPVTVTAPAPAAGMATSLNAPQAPAAAPAPSSSDVHIYSAPAAAPAVVTVDPEDHKG